MSGQTGAEWASRSVVCKASRPRYGTQCYRRAEHMPPSTGPFPKQQKIVTKTRINCFSASEDPELGTAPLLALGRI